MPKLGILIVASSSASSGGGSDSGPGHVVLGCYGVPFGGGGALFLRHSCTAFTGFFGGQTGRAAASMLAFVRLHCTFSSTTLAPRCLEKESLRFNHSTFRHRKATKDPPLTPNSQAKSELAQTEQKQARTHSPHTNVQVSSSRQIHYFFRPTLVNKSFHSYKKATHSKYDCKPQPPLPVFPQAPSFHFWFLLSCFSSSFPPLLWFDLRCPPSANYLEHYLCAWLCILWLIHTPLGVTPLCVQHSLFGDARLFLCHEASNSQVLFLLHTFLVFLFWIPFDFPSFRFCLAHLFFFLDRF